MLGVALSIVLSFIYMAMPLHLVGASPARWFVIPPVDAFVNRVLTCAYAGGSVILMADGLQNHPRSRVLFATVSSSSIILAAGSCLSPWNGQGLSDVTVTLGALASGLLVAFLAHDLTMRIMLANMVAVCVYTVYTYYFGYSIMSGSALRSQGPHGVTITSMMIAVIFPICFYCYFCRRTKLPAAVKALTLACCCASVAAMLALKCIGSAFIAASVTIFGLYPLVRLRRNFGIAASLIVLFASIILCTRISGATSLRSTQASMMGRAALLDLGLNRAREAWPLGEGAGSPNLAIFNPISKHRSESVGSHNLMIDVLMRYGFIGAGLLICNAYAIFSFVRNDTGEHRKALVLLWVSIALCATFESITLTQATYPLTFMVGIVLALTFDRNKLNLDIEDVEHIQLS